MRMDGHYKMLGRILLVPLKGAGKIVMEIGNCKDYCYYMCVDYNRIYLHWQMTWTYWWAPRHASLKRAATLFTTWLPWRWSWRSAKCVPGWITSSTGTARRWKRVPISSSTTTGRMCSRHCVHWWMKPWSELCWTFSTRHFLCSQPVSLWRTFPPPWPCMVANHTWSRKKCSNTN